MLKHAMMLAALLTAGCMIAHAQATSTSQGPFGFRPGMTRDEVIRLVGTGVVEKTEDPDDLLLKTAPRPHSSFENYLLTFSRDRGLVWLKAIGRNIRTSSYGNELQVEFRAVREAISGNYGEAKTYDFLRAGSIWDEPRDWMMGLLRKERILTAYWLDRSRLSNHVQGIRLEAKALSTGQGYLVLTYEFEGWNEYIATKKAEESSVF
ncbi:MAG: hypothetical protein ACM3S5_17955 [Rhodospirillales bacterium]